MFGFLKSKAGQVWGGLKNLWARVAAGGGNVGAWIAQAAKYTSIPPDWVAGIRTIIARESGGNPNAINLTDVNAQRGDPSIGLMQVIGSTFRTYRDARLPNNQRDPVANIVAGVNYIRSRDGSIHNVQQADPSRPPKGYASGGILGPGQLGFNETTRPEYILNGAQFAQLANGGKGLNIDRLTVNLGNREFEGYVDSRIDESNRELSLTLVGR
jgi:SLT domain-containing protein